MKIRFLNGMGIIFLAAFISWILSLSANYSEEGLGGFYNLFWPPVVGILSVLIYGFICWQTKRHSLRLGTVIVLAMYLLYIGIALFLEREDWPYVYW